MTTTQVLQTIEMAPPVAEEAGRPPESHPDLRQALAAERVRIRHMCKALACTEDASLRQRWQSEMADSLARVRHIEKTLRSSESQADQHAADMMDECLLEAMELARANGDSRAAEIVAKECMALVELRCMRIRQGHMRRSATPAGNDAIHYQGAESS
jgi:hypothetical protein